MKKVYVVIEVIEGNPQTWVLTSREKAEKKIKKLIEEHEDGCDIPPEKIKEDIREAIENGEFHDDFGYGLFLTHNEVE